MLRFFSLLLLLLGLNVSAQTSFDRFIQKIKTERNSKAALKSLDSITQKKKLSSRQLLACYDSYIRHAHYLSEYDLALKYALKGVDLSKKIKDDSMHVTFLRFEGNTYYYSAFRDQALVSYKKGIKIAREKKIYWSEAAILNNTGAIYIETQKYDLAEHDLLRSIELMKKIGQENTTAAVRTYRLLALLYDSQNKLDEARKIYLKVIRLAEKTGDSNVMSSANLYYGNHFVIKKEYDSAIYYNKRGIDYLKTTRDPSIYKASLSIQAELFEKIGDFKNAYLTLKQYYLVYEDLEMQETRKKISDIRIKYDTEKKEQSLKLKNVQLKQSRDRFNFILLASILSFIVLILIGLFVYLKIRWKHKISAEIEKIKKEQEIAESKERERTRIARELHDNIGSTISFITNKTELILKSQNESSFNREDLIQVKDSAREVMGDLRETLWALNTKNISNTDLADKLKVYIKKHALIPVNIREKLESEKNIPNESALAVFRSCQEIVNNCNKYSDATQLQVSIFSSAATSFEITFSDNGKGFEPEEKDGSYGLRNIRSRMQEIKAQFSLYSTPGKGTEIKISL